MTTRLDKPVINATTATSVVKPILCDDTGKLIISGGGGGLTQAEAQAAIEAATNIDQIAAKLVQVLAGVLPSASSDAALIASLRDPVFAPKKASITGFTSIAAANNNLLDSTGAGAATDITNWQSGELTMVSTATFGTYTVQVAFDSAFTIGVTTLQLFEVTAQNANPINSAITLSATTRKFALNLQGANWLRVFLAGLSAGARPYLVVSQSPFVPFQTNVQQAIGASLNASVTSLPTLPTLGAITNLGVSQFVLTAFRNAAVSNTPIAVKVTAGRVHAINVINPNASPVYLKIYNAVVGSTIVGTTTPFKIFFIPASDRFFVEAQLLAIANLSTAITIAIVTGVADASTTAPATALHVEIEYA